MKLRNKFQVRVEPYKNDNFIIQYSNTFGVFWKPIQFITTLDNSNIFKPIEYWNEEAAKNSMRRRFNTLLRIKEYEKLVKKQLENSIWK